MSGYTSNTPIRLEPLNPLLVYLPDYGVLICKECKFAIQPKAIPSHLLRHRVYREKRQDLLSLVADLTLLDPAQVSIPSPHGRPIPYLPIAGGYRCLVQRCGHLCVSYKRMSQHLHQQHQTIHLRDVDGQMQRVFLQTFFRGNQISYFQVSHGDLSERPRSSQQNLDHQFLEPQTTNVATLTRATSHENTMTLPQDDLLTNSHIQDLMYMHRYVTSTASSLTRGTEPVTFWAQEIPLQAKTHTFLMHGILGAAAFHSAMLASSHNESAFHHGAGLRHQSTGLATFRKLIDSPSRQTSTALTAFARLLGIQFCEEALLEAKVSVSRHDENNDSSLAKILEFLSMLNGGCDLLLGLQPLLPPDSALRLSGEDLHGLASLEIPPDALLDSTPYIVNDVFAWIVSHTRDSSPDSNRFSISSLEDVRNLVLLCRDISKLSRRKPASIGWIASIIPRHSSLANHIPLILSAVTSLCRSTNHFSYNISSESQLTPCPILLCYPHIPADIYSELASLPTRLVGRISEPNEPDLRAFDHAMAALVSSFARSYATDATCARWNGVESWPRMLPDHFLGMAKANHPLALLLMVHWCALLFRQEPSYWFLQGQSRRMLDIIFNNLDGDLLSFARDCFASLTKH
ncbi:hypothetical protein B0A52_09726 [Exophiala mesophila]|uniref:C2H2-type domain-containing protein n=1 Tax=Exophiala mesophila TaxID=212818 RepID=A0A438MRK9_EXOME|nr:hypothetical protein B0A52_09726 [Exophiala mesophila]